MGDDRSTGTPPWPVADAEILAAVQATLADGDWGAYHGPRVPQLDAELARYHGVDHALTCVSGTFALETALSAVGVRPGDEVIMAGYDYEPNFLCVHAVGAKPVLIDVDPDNACLDVTRVADAIGPKTKAVIASHLHGGVVPMADLMAVAASRKLAVIEDAAQATGAIIQGRHAGTWGDVGIISFGGTKLLSAGRGGAMLINREDVHQRARVKLRRGGQQIAPLSELQAAVLLPQLARLSERNLIRTGNVVALCEALADIPGLRPFRNRAPDVIPSYYKLGFWYDVEAFGLPRERFVAEMRAGGVAFSEGWKALNVGRGPSRYRAVGDLPNVKAAGERVVALFHPVLLGDAETVAGVAHAVRKVYRSANA